MKNSAFIRLVRASPIFRFWVIVYVICSAAEIYLVLEYEARDLALVIIGVFHGAALAAIIHGLILLDIIKDYEQRLKIARVWGNDS